MLDIRRVENKKYLETEILGVMLNLLRAIRDAD